MSHSLSAARPVARTVVLILSSTPFLLAESNSGADLPAPAVATAGAPVSTGSAPPQASSGTNQGMIMLVMAVGLVAMFLFAGRSQKKEERKAQEMRSKLKRGDAVVTIGGMHGEVASVGEATVDVRFGNGDHTTEITFNKSAIASIAGADAAKAK